MKTLELNQMQVVEGGERSCTSVMVGTAGIATALVIAGALTGGVGWAVGAMLFTWGGAAAGAASCINKLKN